VIRNKFPSLILTLGKKTLKHHSVLPFSEMKKGGRGEEKKGKK
jgi:hypothetical protein